MLFLAGLVGAMVVGSVAILSSVPGDDSDDQASSGGAEDIDPEVETDTEAALEPGEDILGAAVQSLTMSPEGGLITAGSDDPDDIVGTDQTDQLSGGAGNDTLSGQGGDDELLGGADDDWIAGGDGNDTLHGEAGGDRIFGDAGADSIYGHDGDDWLSGGDGADSLEGGLGNDNLAGDGGADALHGREGADTLSGGTGIDTLFGGDGNDLVLGIDRDIDVATATDVSGADFVNGGAGNDTLLLGDGDTGSGGTGADSFVTGHWIGVDGASITDFEPAEDRMIVVYDDALGPPEDIGYHPDPEAADQVQLRSGDQVLATMPAGDAPPLGDIILIAASEAQDILVPA
ncbi:calcium-binding protein [Roseivivax sp. CAU 1753]